MRSLDALSDADRTPELEQPPYDARMDGDEFVAFVDVPGLIEPPVISSDADRLVVEGVRTTSARARARRFAREIALPPGVDRDRLELDYVAGVLRVCVPPRAPHRSAITRP